MSFFCGDFVYGCSNPDACNYDPEVVFNVPSSCMFIDGCGECVLPTDTSCPDDCAGVEGGNAVLDYNGNCCFSGVLDSCSVCNGNDEPNTGLCDCAGVSGGNGWELDCGVCDTFCVASLGGELPAQHGQQFIDMTACGGSHEACCQWFQDQNLHDE